MTALDELHCDPPAAALSSRLRAAGLDATRADLWRLGVYTDPQGVLRHQVGTTTVTLAWWPDHRGSVWVRVRAETPDGVTFYSPPPLPADDRPPLCHVGRDRVFRVSHDDNEGRWLTACPCGEVGTPARTLWMGDRCGACHDRREEGSPPVVLRPSRVDAKQRLLGVDFLPDGSLVAVGQSEVAVIDPRTNAMRAVAAGVRSSRHAEDFPAAISGDGRFVVVPDVGRGLRLVGLKDGSDRIFRTDGEWRQNVSAAFHPGGSRLVATYAGELVAFDIGTDGAWTRVESSIREIATLAFGPTGDELLLATTRGIVLACDPMTLTVRERFEFGSAVTKISPGAAGRILAWANGRILVFDRKTRRVETSGETSSQRARACVAFAPDGRHVATCRDGVVEIRDVFHLRLRATISPIAADAVRLAFSPDGATLAVASWGGEVVLIPWVDLLEAA